MNALKLHRQKYAFRTAQGVFWKRSALVGAVCLTVPSLAGCGGSQGYGGLQQNLGGDISNSYNSPLSSTRGATNRIGIDRGAYPMIETSFQLTSIPGDPYDYEKVNVQVTLKRADGGSVDVPAFFDGGATWRMRFTPTVPGQYSVVGVKLNGTIAHDEKLEKKEWTVSGSPRPGFVRVDRGNHSQFVFDNTDRYFPLGHNVAWQSKDGGMYESIFGKMHTAGENWASVWLDQRDGKALDSATVDKKSKPGEIDLEVAKQWDAILTAAEKNDIYLQLVIEQSGAYASDKGFVNSSNIHPDWSKNPYNATNGGFLHSPDNFFTDPTARTLEKRKLYYILARWGYSPNILAFEMFHDVQYTDAGFGNHWDDIAMWHREMSIFVRQADANHHLLTTSSAPGVPLESPVWQTVDYLQTHAYAPDVMAAVAGGEVGNGKKLDKPLFVGAFGPQDGVDTEGIALHEGLWTGLVSGGSGGAQYWDWQNVEKHNLYDQFKAASAFVTDASLAEHPGLNPATLTLTTSQKASLVFGPGSEATSGGPTEFVVGESGPPSGIDKLSPVLPGKPQNGAGKQLTFQVSYAQAGTFAVTLGQVSKAGAHLSVSMDGKATEKDYTASAEDHAPGSDQATVSVDVPMGSHTVTVQNTGKDWLMLRRFALSNYASALAGMGRVGKDYAIAWIYNRDGVEASEAAAKNVTAATGRITLVGLQNGKYHATWWDTRAGKSLNSDDLTVTSAKEGISLSTPPIQRDVALYIVKAGTPPGGSAKNRSKKSKNVAAPTNTVPSANVVPGYGNTLPAIPGQPPLSQPGLNPLPSGNTLHP